MQRRVRTVADLLGSSRGVVRAIPAGATVHAALEWMSESLSVMAILPSASKRVPLQV
jgi:hypothetical protein